MIMSRLSLVVPAFNEQSSVEKFLKDCFELKSFFYELEVIFVNDGSTDLTHKIVENLSTRYQGLILLNLAVNSGHMAALTAGLERATGDWIATLDADGQDDPNHIVAMHKLCITSNADVCFTQRVNRKKDSVTHRFFSPLFYKLLVLATNNKAIYQSGDFRLISKRVLDSLKSLPEVNRVYRVIIPSLGYKSVTYRYERNFRSAGESKYNFRKLLTLGFKSMLASSGAPLRWSSYLAVISSVVALTISFVAIIQGVFYRDIPGWASLTLIISLMFLVQSITNLVISEFILVLLSDLRKRPLYQLSRDEKSIMP